MKNETNDCVSVGGGGGGGNAGKKKGKTRGLEKGG